MIAYTWKNHKPSFFLNVSIIMVFIISILYDGTLDIL